MMRVRFLLRVFEKIKTHFARRYFPELAPLTKDNKTLGIEERLNRLFAE